MYLDPQDGKEPMFKAAVRLLHNHGESLDPLQVLEVLHPLSVTSIHDLFVHYSLLALRIVLLSTDFKAYTLVLPTSFRSIDPSFSHNNWLEGEVVGSRPIRVCVTYQLKKKKKKFSHLVLHIEKDWRV